MCTRCDPGSIVSFFLFPSVHFLPLLVQSDTADNKVERSADGDEDGSQEEQKEQEVDKMEEGQGWVSHRHIRAALQGVLLNTLVMLSIFVTPESSLGSVGSSEQLPDSDSEQEEGSQQATPSHGPAMELSEAGVDDDQASCSDSLDLSSQSTATADPEQDGEADLNNPEVAEPPTLPDTEPPDEETETATELCVSMAELNVNQSNSNIPRSPALKDVSGIQLTPLYNKKLPLSRNRLSQPDFV